MTGQEYKKSLNSSKEMFTDSDVILAFEMGKKDALKDFHKKFNQAWFTVMSGDIGMDRIECELRSLLEE